MIEYQIQRAFNKKAPPPCLCGALDYRVDPDAPMIQAGVFPYEVKDRIAIYIVITCKQCGQARFFNPALIGIPEEEVMKYRLRLRRAASEDRHDEESIHGG